MVHGLCTWKIQKAKKENKKASHERITCFIDPLLLNSHPGEHTHVQSHIQTALSTTFYTYVSSRTAHSLCPEDCGELGKNKVSINISISHFYDVADAVGAVRRKGRGLLCKFGPPSLEWEEREAGSRTSVCLQIRVHRRRKKQQQQFLHQKQTRLRANLIDFHQYFSGGERRNELIVGLVSSGLEGFE